MTANASYVELVHQNLSHPIPCTGYIIVSLCIIPIAFLLFCLCIRFCCLCDRLTDCLTRRRHRYRKVPKADGASDGDDDDGDDDANLDLESFAVTARPLTATRVAITPTFPIAASTRPSILSTGKSKGTYQIQGGNF
jgi:hypothetical protein